MKTTKPSIPEAPATITAEQLAGLSNLTKRRLYQLADEHKIPQPTNGCFPMLETITAMFSYYQRDGADLQREKLLKTAAERKLREHELGVMENKLCDAKVAQMAVTGAVMAHHAIVKTRMDLDFARLVLERLEGLDETARQKVHDAVSEVARSVVAAIEGDCQKYDK
jgi:hypothetical protein